MNPSAQADLLSQALADALSAARDEVALAVERLVASGADPVAIVSQLADPAFRAEIGLDRQTLGELFEDAATKVLASAPAAVITPEMLDALTTIAQESFLARGDNYWAILQRELTSAVVSGNAKGLRDALRGVDGLRADQVEAAFNSTLNTYSATVGAEVAREDPPDALYTYEGPADDRTRPLCLEMAAAGPLTREQIEERFPGGFVDRGGYNCRHQWVPFRAAFDVNTDEAKNRKARLVEQGRWREPVSVRTAAQQREAANG